MQKIDIYVRNGFLNLMKCLIQMLTILVISLTNVISIYFLLAKLSEYLPRMESAKWRACVLACLACLRAWRAPVLYVLPCFACSRAL